MPYRDLPADFTKRYSSSFIEPSWSELGDASAAGRYYNWSIDELMYAAELGFDGIGTNEHHQNVYGFMCNPNLFGATLARLTRDRGFDHVALVQLGATVAATSPPIRIAEEYAVIDCLSDGRLVAGLPLGLAVDANISYGVPPLEQRERWREGIDLMLKAWTAEETFAWNGKHYQLPQVNLWPRPVQKPHPPLLIPGAGSTSTWDYVHKRNLPYAFLSYFGGTSAAVMLDRYWERAAAFDRDANPYRAGMLQLVAVADTDAKAEEQFAKHIESFYHDLLHFPPHHLMTPGYSDYKSLEGQLTSEVMKYQDFTVDLKRLTAKDMMESGFVIAGSPSTVGERLENMVRKLNLGHLMVVLQFGSMPHELAMENIGLFGREVLPRVQQLWSDDGWHNHWWPERCNKTTSAGSVA
jgi:alkanesulfonate monooxygenase SsuD/methylene tetrahydromethanopterin reductase-like flavin-dependent oxidoreductase (luciferase family)